MPLSRVARRTPPASASVSAAHAGGTVASNARGIRRSGASLFTGDLPLSSGLDRGPERAPALEHGRDAGLEVLAAQPRVVRVREARSAEGRLALVGRPVAVLREQRVPIASVRPEDDEGVAARVEHRRPPARAHLPARRFAGRVSTRFATRAAGAFLSSSSSFSTSISATIPCTRVRAPVWKYALWKTSTSSFLVAPSSMARRTWSLRPGR